MYKSKLQELCQKRQWALPRYTAIKDGPDHNPSFRASVFLNDTAFHSPVSCKSSKEAHNEAAKSVFLHFRSSSSSPAAAIPNPAQEIDFGFYKNLLQELAQREKLSIPEYKTTRRGLAHRPAFFSVVEVEGEVFCGEGAKSKKEAEISAAKVAYTNLIEQFAGLQVRRSELHSPECLAVEDEKNAEESEMQEVKTGKKMSHNSTICANSGSCSHKQGLQVYSSDLAIATVNVKDVEENEVQEEKAGGEVSDNDTNSVGNSSSCSKSVPVSPKLCSTPTHVDISSPSISESKQEKESGLKTYLLNDRFRVYSRFPDIAFPKGITVLPISEDKWVAVRLEFPNERDD